MIRKACYAFSLLLVLSSVAVCFAQVSTAKIAGVVHDTAGAVVPAAEVVVNQTETNGTARATTDARGVFTLPSLPIGPYVMKVKAAGFSSYTRQNIVLTVGQVAELDVELNIGAASETVTVTAAAPLVNQTDPTISSTVDEQTVVGLPLNGRNPAALVFDSGGVSNTAENTGTGQLSATNQITPPQTTIPGSIAPAVNGTRAGGTYFSLDGASNVDPLNVIGGPFPDPDATQEFQVVTGTYGARYISAPGGAVNIVTRAGTNATHGTVFEFLRNGYVNAENAILGQPDTLKRNQFGGTLGGAVVKDKLFYFGSYQGTRIASQTPNAYLVPTADERAGIFQACAAADTTCASPFPVDLTTLPGFLGSTSKDAVNANFFDFKGSGNSLIPAANTSSGNKYVVGVPSHLSSEQIVGRLDYQINQQHRAFARYYFDHATTQAVSFPTKAPYDIFNTSSGLNQNWDNAALGETWNPSASWVLETRLSYLNVVNTQFAPSSATFFTLPSLGAAYTVPSFADGGINVIGSTVPPSTGITNLHPRTNASLTEDVINVRGNHEITFGGSLQRIHAGEGNPSGQSGVIIYAGVFSNILGGIIHMNIQDKAFADFFWGHPVEFIQGDGFFASHHGWLGGVYAQDKFRVSNRLTLTYGLRWDPYIPYTAENNEVSCFRKGEQSTVFTNAPTGLVYPGDSSCPTGGVDGNYKLIQPRVGVAYQVNQKGTDSLHLGYGVYDIQVPLGSMSGFESFPWSRQYIIANPFQSIDDIWGSNGTTDPFTGGFHGFGYKPSSSVVFPTTPTPNAANYASNFRPGYVQQYSVSYQKGLGANDSVELAYVASKGDRLAQNYDLNQPVASATASTSNESARRPYTALAVISTEAPLGFSKYNAAQITYRHRVGGGVDLTSNFTWSKCEDNGSNPGSTGANLAGSIDLVQGAPAHSNGLCDFDQPYNSRSTLVWNAPKLANDSVLTRTVFGSWILGSNLILDSGQPYTVSTASSDNSFTGTQVDRADYVSGQAVRKNGRLNYSAFALNAGGTYGNTPRNGFRSAADFQVDLDMMKEFPLTERLRVMFRAEAFNIVNHPNYFGPLSEWDTTSASTFDTYQNARDPRQLQFAIKLSF